MTKAAPQAALSVPVRFMQDPEWARVASQGLRSLIKGDPEPGQDVLARIAAGLLTCDEPGAALADAIAGKRVTLQQFRQALASGLVEDSPAELAAFFDHVQARPAWVDDALLARGAALVRRAGKHSTQVMDGALISGYRSSADTRMLALTGGLTGESAARRLAETAKFFAECVREGGMRRDRQGWQLTVHVRLMHALVNRQWRSSPEWDIRQWGLPINSSDQAGTLYLHCTYYLIALRFLGVPVSRDDASAVMHLWRYIGWLMGVDDYWLPLSEQDGRRKFYAISLTAPRTDEFSRRLAADAVAAISGQHGRLGGLSRAWARARTVSLLRVTVGTAGLKDLGLPLALPWYHLLLIPVNVLTHRVVGLLPAGPRWLDTRGQRQIDAHLHRMFGTAAHGVAAHPSPPA